MNEKPGTPRLSQKGESPVLTPRWRILDCTLRDGGYYTQWDFPDDLVRRYLTAMSRLPVSCVELGYVSPPSSGYAGRYYYLSRDTIAWAREAVPAAPPLAVMLDAKNCEPSAIADMLGDLRGSIDVVRFAIDPAKFEHGIELATATKELGFQVGANFMYLSRHWDDPQFFDRLEQCAQSVDVVALVDSYGACYPDQVGAAILRARNATCCAIGFHGHENLTLAFANSIAAIDNGASVIDSTILGIGRGAGNLRTEIITMFHSQQTGQSVDLLPAIGLLDEFRKMKAHHEWGAELPYIVSGFGSLPQKNVMEWLSKKRYSTHAIVAALQGDRPAKGSMSDFSPLATAFRDHPDSSRDCILIGGGASVQRHAAAISAFATRRNATLVHSSPRNTDAFRQLAGSQMLCIVGDEASKLEPEIISELLDRMSACVVDSDAITHEGIADELINRMYSVEPVLNSGERVNSPLGAATPLGTALGVALAIGAERIYLAGFDGYQVEGPSDSELNDESQKVLDAFRQQHPDIPIASLTPSAYRIDVQSVYSKLVSSSKAAEDVETDAV